MRFLVCFLWLFGCTQEGVDTIPYSTARIGESQKVSKGETTLKFYHNAEEILDGWYILADNGYQGIEKVL